MAKVAKVAAVKDCEQCLACVSHLCNEVAGGKVARWPSFSRGGLCKNVAVFVYILQVHTQILPRSTKKSVEQYKAVKWNR